MRMQLKGQIEFVAVIAFVILGIVSIYVMTQPNGLNSIIQGNGIKDESGLIKDSVTNLIRAGMMEATDKVYDNGGYTDASSVTNVKYGGLSIPVWQACSDFMIPDTENEIKSYLLDYIGKNIEKNSDFYGKNVTFDLNHLSVKVRMTKGTISADVNLPTTVNGNAIPQPYKASVRSNIDEMINFAKDFINESNSSHIFETAIMSSMILSNPDSSSWMPVSGIIHKCGKRIIKTRRQFIDSLKQLTRYSINHIIWHGRAMTDTDNIFFNINTVSGRAYDNIKAEFAYPPSWDSELARKFSSKPETLNVVGLPVISFVPACMTNYYVSYSFQYPVIVSVYDDSTGKYFRFAAFTSIKDNKPDSICTSSITSGHTQYEEDCILSANCDYNITVTNSAGNPIQGADVVFYKCSLGKTDENGKLVSSGDTKAPCIAAGLEIYKKGYMTYGDFISINSLNGTTIKLTKKQTAYKIYFFGVPLKAKGKISDGVYSSYEVTGPQKNITDFKDDIGNADIMLSSYFYPSEPNYITNEDTDIFIFNSDEEGNLTSNITNNMFYPSEFDVNMVAYRNSTKTIVGLANTTFNLNEGDDSIYIYVPIVTQTDEGPLQTSINETETAKLSGLASCMGGSIISNSKLSDAATGCVF